MSKLVYVVVGEDESIESVHPTVSEANQAIEDLECMYSGQYKFKTTIFMSYGDRHRENGHREGESSGE